MATITKTIGTSSRDYSTMLLWEADLDDDSVYDAGDDAVGACYNDSAFDMAGTYLYIDSGGSVGGGGALGSVKLTAPEGQRHDGTAGTGVRIVSTTAHNRVYMRPQDSAEGWQIVEWIECNNNGRDTISFNSSGATDCVPVLRNCIIHNGMRSLLQAINKDCRALNNLFYAGGATDDGGVKGVDIDADLANGGFLNNTIYGINNDTSTALYGLYIRNDDTDGVLKNNIVMGTSSSGGATPVDIRFPSFSSNIASDYNMTSDSSGDNAGGSNNLIDKTTGDQFVSTTTGSEDFYLKDGADAIHAGVDLATTPNGVNIDIKGFDRASHGVIWDIGASQNVHTYNAAFAMFVD